MYVFIFYEKMPANIFGVNSTYIKTAAGGSSSITCYVNRLVVFRNVNFWLYSTVLDTIWKGL